MQRTGQFGNTVNWPTPHLWDTLGLFNGTLNICSCAGENNRFFLCYCLSEYLNLFPRRLWIRLQPSLQHCNTVRCLLLWISSLILLEFLMSCYIPPETADGLDSTLISGHKRLWMLKDIEKSHFQMPSLASVAFLHIGYTGVWNNQFTFPCLSHGLLTQYSMCLCSRNTNRIIYT